MASGGRVVAAAAGGGGSSSGGSAVEAGSLLDRPAALPTILGDGARPAGGPAAWPRAWLGLEEAWPLKLSCHRQARLLAKAGKCLSRRQSHVPSSSISMRRSVPLCCRWAAPTAAEDDDGIDKPASTTVGIPLRPLPPPLLCHRWLPALPASHSQLPHPALSSPAVVLS